MRKTILGLSLLAMLCLALPSFAQRTCGVQFEPDHAKLTDKGRYLRYQQLEKRIQDFSKSEQAGGVGARLLTASSTIIIPVVVHVVHTGTAIGTGTNISDAQIQSQITVLNEDFRRLNANRTNTPAGFLGVAADPNIEFRLACVDPTGAATNGITRTSSSTSFGISNYNNIKSTAAGGHDGWPSDKYLNIWVGNITAFLGVSSWPFDQSTSPQLDGVVIGATYFGTTGSATAPFHLGRTATHEVGHWLSLYHIWGSNNPSDASCSDSDDCSDTPNQADANGGCPSSASSCSNGGDMFMNYMDYTDDACMNLFTNGQKSRMRAMFATGGPRASFITNALQIVQPTSVIVCSSINLTASNNMNVPVTWTVVSGPLQITAGQNTNTVTLTKLYDGEAVVRVEGCGYIDEITLLVGIPPIDFMSFTNGANGSPYFCTSHTGNEFYPSFSFTAQSASVEWRLLSYPSLSVVYTDPTWRPVYTPIPVGSSYAVGWYVLEARLHHACGTSDWTGFEVEFVNCSEPGGGGCPDCGFRVQASPNPAVGDINVTLEDITADAKALSRSAPVKYVLYDFNQTRAIRQWTFDNGQGKRSLNIRGLKSGQYVLVVTKGKYRKSTRIIIK
ncbi:M43 family zinc metalloprotease [Paraflavitalea pollutisoli]|uniref:M43 family zinc metalloprotease n=1 Tax=Paraflavitalea pollutisoli TaxID=3034143 RepID=UPI0023EB56D6|nr:M43 family zinc metalloprotease [Paraflavitalea sp. H1-2-19X]